MRKMITLLIATLLITACGRSQPSQFYVLTDMANSKHQQRSRPFNLGVGPITLPKYLDKPEIVTREHGNELQLAEFHRWAEGLTDNVVRVVGDNINAMLPNSHIYSYPWNAKANINYQVEVDVRRFEMDSNYNCVLTAQWNISRENQNKSLVVHRKTYKIRTQHETNYRHIAELMSRNLLKMSHDIVKDLIRVSRR